MSSWMSAMLPDLSGMHVHVPAPEDQACRVCIFALLDEEDLCNKSCECPMARKCVSKRQVCCQLTLGCM